MNDTNQFDTPEPAGGFAGGAEGIGGPDPTELPPGMSSAGEIMAADGDSPGEGASGSGAGRGGKKVKKKPVQEESSGGNESRVATASMASTAAGEVRALHARVGGEAPRAGGMDAELPVRRLTTAPTVTAR